MPVLHGLADTELFFPYFSNIKPIVNILFIYFFILSYICEELSIPIAKVQVIFKKSENGSVLFIISCSITNNKHLFSVCFYSHIRIQGRVQMVITETQTNKTDLNNTK